MPEWISELKFEWWVLFSCAVFLAVFGRMAIDYLKELFGGIE